MKNWNENIKYFQTRSRKFLIVGLFCLALLPRLLYLASIPPEAVLESVDARGYDQLARNLHAGRGFSLSPPSTPEPAGVLLTLVGVAGLASRRRR